MQILSLVAPTETRGIDPKVPLERVLHMNYLQLSSMHHRPSAAGNIIRVLHHTSRQMSFPNPTSLSIPDPNWGPNRGHI